LVVWLYKMLYLPIIKMIDSSPITIYA